MNEDDIRASLHGCNHTPSILDSTTRFDVNVVVMKKVFEIYIIPIGIHKDKNFLLLPCTGAPTNIRTEFNVA